MIILLSVIIIILIAVIIIKSKRKVDLNDKNGLGDINFVPPISKTLDLERVQENGIIIPINPVTSVIDEKSLFEITDRTVIARISTAIPSAANTAAKTITNKALKNVELYKMDIPSTALVKSKEVEGTFRAFSRGKNEINKNANLVKIDPAKISKTSSVANSVANVMNVSSLVVGQYYMSEINSKLETMNKNIEKISDFQDREFKSRILSLLSRVGEISQFNFEIMENDEQRHIKLTIIEDLKGTATELLGQVNITIDDISQKNANLNYQEYQKCVDDFIILVEYQNVLIAVLSEISRLTYLLGKGSISSDISYNLFNKYLEQSVQIKNVLEQWHDRQVELLHIDLDKNRKSKTGIEGFFSAIPGFFDDEWKYKKLKNGLKQKINAQKTKNHLIHNNPLKDVYDNDVQIIIKDGKYYYLHE